MLDANGREIRVGDLVATPYPHLVDMPTAETVANLPTTIKNATLGRVMEFGEDFQGEFIYLEGYDDGIVYGPKDIVTLGGLEWVTCPECGESWPFDVRMNDVEECPFCDAPLRLRGWPWVCQWCGIEYPDTHPYCDCKARVLGNPLAV